MNKGSTQPNKCTAVSPLKKSETPPVSRIPGCQSTNHEQCDGELWQCSACDKTVCHAEGTTDHPELCDDCWTARFHPTTEPVGTSLGDALFPSEFMGQMIRALFKHYGAEVLSSGLLYLELVMNGYGVLVIEEKIKQQQMSVCYWLYDAQRRPVREPEMLFFLDEYEQWIPLEIRRHTVGVQVYAKLDEADTKVRTTGEGSHATLAEAADAWAKRLRIQGWLGNADKVITQLQPWLEVDDEAVQPPSVDDLWDWVDEYGKCTSTDGCWVEADGVCEHGHKSWLLELGLI